MKIILNVFSQFINSKMHIALEINCRTKNNILQNFRGILRVPAAWCALPSLTYRNNYNSHTDVTHNCVLTKKDTYVYTHTHTCTYNNFVGKIKVKVKIAVSDLHFKKVLNSSSFWQPSLTQRLVSNVGLPDSPFCSKWKKHF